MRFTRKGVVMIMSVYLSARTICGKLEHWQAESSYWQTSNYARNKKNKRHLLKPFSYKVMTIYMTHGHCFQTLEDSWGQLVLFPITPNEKEVW